MTDRPTAVDLISRFKGKRGPGFTKPVAHSWCYICSLPHAFEDGCLKPPRACSRCKKQFVPSVDRVFCSRRCRDQKPKEVAP